MLTAKKIIQASIIIILAGFCTAANAADVFDSVPDDALVALRINHYEGTMGQIDQFLAGMVPMLNPTSMMTRMQLTNMIGDPNMSNVNLMGQIAIFATVPPKDPNKGFIGVLIPVADYSKFISSNPSAAKPDSNGVSSIGQMKMMVLQAGDYALLSPMNDYKGLTAAVKSAKAKNLSSVLGQANSEAAVPGRIWIYANAQLAMKLYGPIVLTKIEDIRKMISMQNSNMAMPPQLMECYFEFIKRMMNETKTIMLAFDPKPNVLNFTTKFTAVPGTKMDEIFVAGSADKSTNSLLGYLPDNALMDGGARLNKTMLITFYEELVDIFAPAMGPKFTEDERTKLLKLIKDSVNSIGKSYVYSSICDPNSKSILDAIYVLEVADNNAFQKCVDAGMEMMNAPYVQDFMDAFGMQMACDIKRNAETYKDVPIDTFKIAMKHKDANSPMGQMLVKMYGEGFKSRMAVVKGLGLCAVGTTADTGIKALIDKALSDKPQAVNPELKKAMSLIPQSDQAQFVGTLNYLRSLQNSFRYMPQGMPFNTEALENIVSKSNIAFAGNMNGGVATLNIAVPKEHVIEIKSAIESSIISPAQQQENMIKKFLNQPAPQVETQTLDGKPWMLSDHKGKVLLIDFWATWCVPCVQAMPEIKAIYEKYKNNSDFKLIGVSLDHDKEALAAFIAKENIQWQQLFEDNKSFNNSFARALGINGVPSVWIVDKDGIIRGMNLDSEQVITAKLDELLGKQK